MKKLTLLIEIGIIVVILGYYFINIGIPLYKNTFGSSDKLINTKNYVDMIELNINDTNFSIILNKDKNIDHLFFFTPKATCLYNKNIEKLSLNDGLEKIIKILIEKDYLKNNNYLQVISYEDKYLSTFKKSLLSILNKYHIDLNITYTKNTLLNKIKELNLEDNNDYLKVIDLYSKELCSNYKETYLNDKTSLEYAKNIYLKVQNYYNENKEIPNISLIPADKDGLVFPEEESYGIIDNNNLTLYIKLEEYSYCFMGNIDNYKKGVC